MIQAVAIGPDQLVYSTTRAKGSTHVVAHSPTAARSLFETKEALRALWVAADGCVHAAGKRYHTSRGGTWTSHTTGASDAYAMWGTADEIFMGTADGQLLRSRAPDDWQQLAKIDGAIFAIAGTSGSDVHFGGEGVLGHFDGTTAQLAEAPGGIVQDFYVAGGELWVCNGIGVLHRAAPGAPFTALCTVSDEIYGLGKGLGGFFIHGGHQLHRLDGNQLSLVHDNEDKALMMKRGEYATCMASDGRRVVAGGARSVLVEDGLGFAEWPALGGAAKSNKKPAKPKPKAKKPKHS